MKNLWEIWPGAISSEYCEYICAQASLHEAIDAKVGLSKVDGGIESESNHHVRRSTIRWLDVQHKNADIAETLMRFVKRSNRSNFGFDINWMNEIQFTEYHGSPNEGGKYDWHYDTFWENPQPFDRKLSIVVQLSDPSEYTGGEFQFFGVEQVGQNFKQKGSVLVFPSFFHHRVLPVVSGRRLSLVSWVEGPKFR
jgi:PKHD-type hydroxylase